MDKEKGLWKLWLAVDDIEARVVTSNYDAGRILQQACRKSQAQDAASTTVQGCVF